MITFIIYDDFDVNKQMKLKYRYTALHKPKLSQHDNGSALIISLSQCLVVGDYK